MSHIRLAHTLRILLFASVCLILFEQRLAKLASAADFTVNSTVDAVDANPGDGVCATAAGECTLRAAFQETNALAGDDTIALPAGTYALTLGKLTITDNLVLEGEGAATTIIDGQWSDFIIYIRTDNPLTVAFWRLTLQHGHRAIYDENYNGSLSLYDVVIRENQGYNGVGIWQSGAVYLERTQVISNTATTGGGGIFNYSGLLTIVDSVISYNIAVNGDGAGIDSLYGIVNIYHSVLAHNRAIGDLVSGGAIIARTLSLYQSEVSENEANVGGGLDVYYNLMIIDSLLRNNVARRWGGGIISSGTLLLSNSTLTGNVAAEVGGALYYTSNSAILTHATLSSNSAEEAGGIHNFNGQVLLRNTILAGNIASLGPDCRGPITSQGYNLIQDVTDCSITLDPQDLIGVDPLLGPLQDNGGPTWTMALLWGSPAIDAANSQWLLATDQRGVPRPQGEAGDIGAYELENPPTPTFTATQTSTPTSTPTPSSTATSTFTPTPTSTSTPTDTSTPTPTLTPSPTASSTSTPTPTSTLTQTPISTFTPTLTNTPPCGLFEGPVIYWNDFEDGAGGEWSNPSTDISPTGREFLGQFGNSNTRLALSCLPAQDMVHVSFDLYIIRSWDGNQVLWPPELASIFQPNGIVGPDEWWLKADGNTLLHTTYSNWDMLDFYQAYPGSYPDENYPARTGTVEDNTLGYTFDSYPMDAIYHLNFIIDHHFDSLVLDFSANGLQSLQDESWGIDNVEVRMVDFDEMIYLPMIVR